MGLRHLGCWAAPLAACLRAFHPLIPVIASGLRGAWQELMELQPLALPAGLAEIRGELEGDAMAIDNELLCCPGLRKMHLETAQVGARLDILHCVLFPDPRYNLPLFGADVVAGPAGVSAAIVDLSPTGESLSPHLIKALEGLPQRPYSERREVPAWGSIFSKQVLFARLTNAEEERWFEADLLAFHRIFLQAVSAATPDPACSDAVQQRWHKQKHYCAQQRRNDKTRRVLEVAFDPQWADNYIQNLLFDDPPPPCDP